MTVFPATAARSSSAALAGWLRRALALDVRGLACLRIGLAGLLLVDLACRAPDLVAHYTDAGVLSRAARLALAWDYHEPWWMSLHMLSGSWLWQAALFALAALLAGMLLVGWHVPWALAGSWLLLLSLQARFPLLLQGGDVLLRCLLFWSLFAPLDARWSLSRRAGQPDRGYVLSGGTAGILAQLALMYLFTAALKTDPSWRTDFSATHYALSIDHFTRPLGYELLRHPRLLQALTCGAWLLEWAGPLLLLAPIGQTWARTLVPLAFIGFHLGLAATMDLGTFPWICIVAWLAVLPPPCWDALERLPGWLLKSRLPLPAANDSVAWRGAPAATAWAGFLLAYVLLLNVNRLAHPLAQVGQPPLSRVGQTLGLSQYWNMFAPGPYHFGGWLRVEGETADGDWVNLAAPGEPLADDKPANVSATYASQYWRRCFVTAYEFRERPHQEGLVRYFARRWNAARPPQQRVVRARLVHMVTPTPPPFAPLPAAAVPAERRVLCDLEL